MKMLTTQELMNATGVKSRQTLQTYRALGLIGNPVLRKSPKGKGQALFWDETAVQNCLRVKQLRSEGLTLEEVANRLGDSKRRNVKRRGRPPKVDRQSIYSADGPAIAIGEKIVAEIKRIARYARDRNARDLLNREHIQAAIDLAKRGISPVIVVHSSRVVVIEDFVLSLYLADVDEPVAIIVLPLKAFFVQQLEAAKKRYSPVREVAVSQTAHLKESDAKATHFGLEHRGEHNYRVIDLRD